MKCQVLEQIKLGTQSYSLGAPGYWALVRLQPICCLVFACEIKGEFDITLSFT